MALMMCKKTQKIYSKTEEIVWNYLKKLRLFILFTKLYTLISNSIFKLAWISYSKVKVALNDLNINRLASNFVHNSNVSRLMDFLCTFISWSIIALVKKPQCWRKFDSVFFTLTALVFKITLRKIVTSCIFKRCKTLFS